MVESPKFDVFLSHNSVDKPQVEAIAEKLKRRELKVWFDKQIPVGHSFQEEIQQAICQVNSAAIFIGLEGLGEWQNIEVQSLSSEKVKRNILIIPVLLPGVDNIPDNLVFLQQFNWVNFKKIDDPAALDRLESGIRSIKLDSESKLESQPDEILESVRQGRNSTSPSQSIKNLFTKMSNSRTILLTSGAILIFGLVGLQVYRSVMAVDPRYTLLEDLLKEQKWTEADRETARKMQERVGKSNDKKLTSEDFANFPCEDLQTIDNLWLKYSQQHFGFSVQTSIWKEEGSNLSDFVDRVGWGKKEEDGSAPYWKIEDPNFDLADPPGMLPWRITYEGGNHETRKSYISRLLECDVEQPSR